MRKFNFGFWIFSGALAAHTAPYGMKTLVSVAVDGDGNILTIDSQNHCIYKFTPDGQEQAKIGTKGNRPLEFRHPEDIAYSNYNNKVYVVHRVQILNSDLNHIC